MKFFQEQVIIIKSKSYYIFKNDTILSGTGTETDPFIPQDNWNWFYDMYPTQLYNKIKDLHIMEIFLVSY